MFSPQPAKATLLFAKKTPNAGGDTLFANMHLAYDTLSDAMKDMLSDVKVFCASDHFKRKGGSSASRKDRLKRNKEMAAKMLSTEKPQTRKAHPIVRTHPEIERKLLYLGANVQTLDRFTQTEAAPLIEFLDAHSTRPEFICNVGWRPGTLVTWDNRSTAALRHPRSQ